MLTLLTSLALGGSALLYLWIGWRNYRREGHLGDHLPIDDQGRAAVQTSGEFSAATVATTVSLATVILAYTELASWFGLWLLWTVATTVLGLLVVRWTAPLIWDRLQKEAGHRPTLHGFLGKAFESNLLAKAAALCTALGFLGALAIELTVGSKFLAGLAPKLPTTAVVIGLAAVGVTYTALGGFRTVVVTDRIQMFAIWVTLGVLSVTVAVQIAVGTGYSAFAAKVPPAMVDFSWRDGLGSFLVGIALLNIPTFLGDMSVWQRIAGSRDRVTVTRGLTGSAIGAGFSWAVLAILACIIALSVTPREGINPLADYLAAIGEKTGLFASAAFLIIVFGLYAAALSTASTQLIAAGHTLHTDIIRGGINHRELTTSKSELTLSRLLLLIIAAVAVAVVAGLQAAGFSIADLVFAVYGAQLALVPIVSLALFAPASLTRAIGGFAAVAALSGFAAGWGTAGYGKWIADSNLVFLAPLASLCVSTAICALGVVVGKVRKY